MTKLNLSPDVLALNPEEAAKQAKSQAKTPSGQGHGHTDDAQAYKRPKPTPEERRRVARGMMKYICNTALSMLDIWGGDWARTGEARELRAALGKYLELLKEQS